MAAIMEIHFVCDVDARVLSTDFVIYSAYGDQLIRHVTFLVKRALSAILDFVDVDVVVGRYFGSDLSGICDQQSDGACLTFPSVGSVSGGFVALNGELECRPK